MHITIKVGKFCPLKNIEINVSCKWALRNNGICKWSCCKYKMAASQPYYTSTCIHQHHTQWLTFVQSTKLMCEKLGKLFHTEFDEWAGCMPFIHVQDKGSFTVLHPHYLRSGVSHLTTILIPFHTHKSLDSTNNIIKCKIQKKIIHFAIDKKAPTLHFTLFQLLSCICLLLYHISVWTKLKTSSNFQGH